METSHTSVQYSRYLLSLQCLQNAWSFKHLLYAGFGLTNDMLQPCHEVHIQEEIKLPLQQPSLAKRLQVSLTSEAPLILVSSRELIHPHISSGLDSMSSGRWSNASDASSLSRNAPCTISMYHCILSACNHTVPNCFSLFIRWAGIYVSLQETFI